MFFMVNQVNIQQWFQLFSLYCFPLFYFKISKLQRQTQKTSHYIILFHYLLLIFYVLNTSKRGHQYLVPVCAASVAILPNRDLVQSSAYFVKSNFKLKLNNQKWRQTMQMLAQYFLYML